MTGSPVVLFNPTPIKDLKGAIYKLLSPCVRETSNGVAERVALTPLRGLEPAPARG